MRPVGSKYLLEEPLGRGATGTVWRARVRESGQPETAEGVAAQAGETVAIKVLREELASDPDIVMRFLRERSVLLRLTHPNIVRVRDLVVEGDLLALVMDLVEGPDLHRYLRSNGPFTPVAASLLTAQIADALAASHADEVVHRDLKPANVLLVTDGGRMHPLLTDFGIARLADSPGITRTSEFVGTPAYVAPESAEGLPQTSAVDVYGAGILLYELVTGRPPFQGDNPVAVLHQHLSEEPRRPSTVPEPLWTVMERCLRKRPEERPSAVSLGRALRVVADGVGVHASPAAAEAAFGVGALLAPDPRPATVPGLGNVAAQTQVLPTTGRGGPDADPTQVLPAGAQGPGGAMPGSGAGSGPGADSTRLLPPVGEGGSGPGYPPPPGRPPQVPGTDDPHPWQSQLRAARDRNEQTQIQRLDPSEDPLRRRPLRQSAPPPPQQQPQQGPRAGYADPRHQPPPHQPYQQPYQQQRGQAPVPAPAPQRPVPQRQAPRRPEPQPPAPRPRREPRPRSRMRIPGLGCLKGCLTMVVLIVVVVWLAWEVGPLQDWYGEGKSFWDGTVGWIKDAWHWVEDVTGTAEKAG